MIEISKEVFYDPSTGFMHMERPDKIYGEVWLPVRKLWGYKSNWEIRDCIELPFGVCFVSSEGRLLRDGLIAERKSDSKGYLVTCFHGRMVKVHQVVLQTFQPDGVADFVTPDHINKDHKDDNSLKNLQWASRGMQYSNRENVVYKNKQVRCLENNTNYPSCKAAEIALGLAFNTVAPVARGLRKSIKGYTFAFI